MPTTFVEKPSRTAPVVIAKPAGPISDPKQVLNDAIRALGGEAMLRRMRQNYCTGEGRSIILNQLQKYQFKTIAALPDRIRDESRYENGVTFIQVVNGDKGWSSDGPQVRDMDPLTLQSVQQNLYINYVMTLVPLKEPPFALEPLPEQRKDGYLCQAFTVKSKGQRDVTLFFDKDTHLPLLYKTTVVDPNQSEEKDQENYFRDYRDVNAFKFSTRYYLDIPGLKFAARWVIYNAGTKAMELNFSDLQLLDKVEDSFFAKPK